MSQLTFDGFPPFAPLTTGAKGGYKGRVLSHSSVGLYRTCPQKWKFRYVDKVPEKPRSFFSFGKSVHGGLEFLFEKIDEPRPLLEDMLSHYKSTWIREGYETPAQEKWFFQEGERILRGFYAKHQAESKNVFQVEYKFTFEIEGVPITGYIDRIDAMPSGGLHLIDYKTGKAFDKSRVRTDPQLTLYQIAAREIFSKPVESVTLYHLNSLTPLTVPAHPKKLEDELKEVVVEAARGISDQKFDPKPDERGHCQWCDYMQICPAFAGRKFPIAQNAASGLSDMVDRFGKLEAKIKDLAGERDNLGEEIKSHLRASGKSEAQGKHFTLGWSADELPSSSPITVTPKEGDKPA